MVIQQDSFQANGTPWALAVIHRSKIEKSAGTAAVMARIDKLAESADIGIGSHGEAFCTNCSGAVIGINGETRLMTNSTKTVTLIGVNGQSGILGDGATLPTTHAHTVIGVQSQIHFPKGSVNTGGGINIDALDGIHNYGLKISQQTPGGNQFVKGISVDGDIDTETNRYILFNRSSDDSCLKSGIIFRVDGNPVSQICVNNDKIISFTGGVRAGGDVYAARNSHFKTNRLSTSPAITAGISFLVDGSQLATIGVDNDGFVSTEKGYASGVVDYASLPSAKNGSTIYCSNCNTPATPGANCATGGDNAGAEAHRIRGSWKCF